MHCYILNIEAVGLMVLEKIFLVFHGTQDVAN